MAEQDTTPTPTPPPKESPFPKPEPAASSPGITTLLEAQAASNAPSVPVLPLTAAPVPKTVPKPAAPAAASSPGITTLLEAQAASIPPQAPILSRATAAAPKTIRMVRPTVAPGPVGQTPRPGSNPLPPGPPPPSAPQIQAAKSKTSRISLESAISSTQAGVSESVSVAQAGIEGAPKTIRLKRPAEMPTLKVPAVQPGTHVPVPTPRFTAPIPAVAPPSRKTSRMPEPEEPAESATVNAVPLTQKRTIRVKRPGMDSAAPVASDEPVEDAALTPLPPELALRPAADTCNPVFIIAAAASIIVTGILIYLFYQQMYGADALIY
jgi:hypothetical protein